MTHTRPRLYPVHDFTGTREPDYRRVVLSLTDEELAFELRHLRGDAGYRAALVEEQARRAR